MSTKTAKLNTAKIITVQIPEVGASGYTLETTDPSDVAGASIALVDSDSNGTYRGTFTPDSVGEWLLELDKDGVAVEAVSKISVEVTESTIDDNKDAIDTVSTTVTANGNSISTVDGKVTSMATEVDDVKATVYSNSLGVVAIDTKVSTVDGKVDAMQADIDANTTALTNLQTSVDSINAVHTAYIV